MKIGSLVVVIKDGGRHTETGRFMINHGYKSPSLGEICTVRGFTEHKSGIFLEEYVNPVVTAKFIDGHHTREIEFSISAFRELQPPMAVNIEALLPENVIL